MTTGPSTSHRILLVLSALLLLVVAIIFLVAPGVLLDQLGVAADDRLIGILRVGGTGLLAESVIVVLALRAREGTALRLVTIMLVVQFSAETVVRLGSLAAGEGGSIVAALPQAVLAVGLAVELARSRTATQASERVRATT